MRRRQAPVLDSHGHKQVHTSMWTQDAGGEWMLPISNLIVSGARPKHSLSEPDREHATDEQL